jgi:HEAT repeats
MKWQQFVAVFLAAAALAAPAEGGIFFGKKKPPVDPAQRVPELLGIVKTSPDEHKRSQAAEELRKYDMQSFPEVVPTLVDVLLHDAKPSVRVEAAQSLGRIRPISQTAGQALEQALASDGSMRVRLQARSSLLQYYWAGYRSMKKEAPPPPPQTKEPPLAPPLPGETPAQSLPLPPTGPPTATSPSQPGIRLPAVPGEPVPPVIVTTPQSPGRAPSPPTIHMSPVPSRPRRLPVGPTQPPQ